MQRSVARDQRRRGVRLAMWFWTVWLACGTDAGDPCGATGEPPATVGDVVDRIGALPFPVTLECFVTSLPRPFPVEASGDIFSAQPAIDQNSPRLLTWYPGLTLTFATAGPGAALVELGELSDDTHSIKAEIAFPVADPLPESAPYERVRGEDLAGSKCVFCHADESEVEPGVFTSAPLRPDPLRVVPLAQVEGQAEACARDATDPRCTLLRAMFDHGDVEHTPLPDYWGTLYEP